MSPEPPPALPVLNAILLADAVLRDEYSGKCTVVGIFDSISAAAFPAEHRNLWLYLSLTELHGSADIEVRIVTADEDETVLFGGPLPRVDSESPLLVHEVPAVIDRVVFPAPGEYRLQLLVGVEVFAERRLFVTQTSAGGGPDAT